MYNGVINVYKEPGYTSHDVVARLRGILKQKKIGHTGTLDPAAEGVLPVCLGAGTRLCDMLADRTKTYEAVLLLGVCTDTQDTTGTILAEKKEEAGQLDPERVKEVILNFKGDYDQVPPMYSALKVDGKKLCDLARAGKEVERKARRVHIFEISVEKMELPRVHIRVTCSKGTYIRTLCDDIGKLLGVGGCMEHLLRTRVGRFSVEESLTLDEIEKKRDDSVLESCIVSVEDALSDYPVLVTALEGDKALSNGNPCFYQQFDWERSEKVSSLENGARFRVRNSQGRFMGVYEYQKEKRWWKPWKMFIN